MLNSLNFFMLLLFSAALSSLLIVSGRSFRLYYINKTPKYIPKWFFDFLIKNQTFVVGEKYKTYHLILSWVEDVIGISILLFMIYLVYITKNSSIHLLIALIIGIATVYLSYKFTSPK